MIDFSGIGFLTADVLGIAMPARKTNGEIGKPIRHLVEAQTNINRRLDTMLMTRKPIWIILMPAMSIQRTVEGGIT